MPRYRTQVAHSLGQHEAIARLKAYGDKARGYSDLKGVWDENTFTFTVSVQGIKMEGTLCVEEDSLDLDSRLPLVAMPFAGWIRRILNKGLERAVIEEAMHAAPSGVEARASARRESDGTAPVVLFLHIPKAGGSTLGEFVYNQCRAEEGNDEGLLNAGVLFLPYGFFKEPDLIVPEHIRGVLQRDDLRAVIGHFWFGLHEHLSRPATYITLLRDPVERIISLYHYLKLEDRISFEEFAASPPFKEADNDQTRRIAGVDPDIGQCTEATLRAARENLRRHFSVVGTTERFDETLVLLKRKLGWDKEILSYPRNVNADKPSKSSISPEAITAVRSWNELDYKLWQFASGLLDEGIAVAGNDFGDDLARYKSLQPAVLAHGQ